MPPIRELQKFREKYPQYNDLDDTTIANRLAQKYPEAYGDLPDKVIGSIQTPETNLPLEANPKMPMLALKGVADIIPGAAYAAQYWKRGGAFNPQAIPQASEDVRLYEQLKPEGLGQQLTYGIPLGVGRLPFYKGVGIPALATHPIISGMTTFGGMGALERILEGQPQQAPMAGVLGAAGYIPMHIAGLLGGLGRTPLARRALTGLGFGGMGMAMAPEGEKVSEGVIGAGIGAMLPTPPRIGIPDNPVNLFMKAIKPGIKGKESRTSIKNYYDNALMAMNEILNRKGKISEGKIPENLNEFSNAAKYTKEDIYQEYSILEEATGKKTNIPIKQITDTLKKEFIDQKSILPNVKVATQEMIDYLKQMYSIKGFVSLDDATKAIRYLNENLSAKPLDAIYEGKAKPMTRTVELLRDSVDNIITQKTGGEWSELRKKYAAIRQIEGDVNKALVREAKKQNPGVMNSIMNTVADSNIVAGIITMNPTLLIHGATTKAIYSSLSHLRDPNYQVRKAFRLLEMQRRGIPSSVPESVVFQR